MLGWFLTPFASAEPGEGVDRQTIAVPADSNRFRTDSELDLVIRGATVHSDDRPSCYDDTCVIDRVYPQESLALEPRGQVEITGFTPPKPRRLSMNTPLLLKFGPAADPRGAFVDVAIDVAADGPVRLDWWATGLEEGEFGVPLLMLLGPSGFAASLASSDEDSGRLSWEWWLPKGRWVARIRPSDPCFGGLYHGPVCDGSKIDVSWGVGIVRMPPRHPLEPPEPAPNTSASNATVLGLGPRTPALEPPQPVNAKLRVVEGRDVVLSWEPSESKVEWSNDGAGWREGTQPLVFEAAASSELHVRVWPQESAQNITFEAVSLARPVPSAQVAAGTWAEVWLRPTVDPRGAFVDVAFQVAEPGLYDLVVRSSDAAPLSLSMSGPGCNPLGLPIEPGRPSEQHRCRIETPGTYVGRATGAAETPERRIELALRPADSSP